MDALVGPIFQVSIILGIFYAWTIGFNRESKFRPGRAKNMKEEFTVYGLPFWFMYTIGTFKLILSTRGKDQFKGTYRVHKPKGQSVDGEFFLHVFCPTGSKFTFSIKTNRPCIKNTQYN